MAKKKAQAPKGGIQAGLHSMGAITIPKLRHFQEEVGSKVSLSGSVWFSKGVLDWVAERVLLDWVAIGGLWGRGGTSRKAAIVGIWGTFKTNITCTCEYLAFCR